MRRLTLFLSVLSAVFFVVSINSPSAMAAPPGCYNLETTGETSGYVRRDCPADPDIEPTGCYALDPNTPDDAYEIDCDSDSINSAVESGYAVAAENCVGSFFGLPPWYNYLDLNGDCEVVGPSETVDGVQGLVWPTVVGLVTLAVVEAMLMIAALVTVGYVMYGGFRFITSQGDPEGAKSARQTVINALIGLVIAMVASGVVRFIGARLG